MSWDVRQRAMLEAMGLRVWAPLPPIDTELQSEPQSAAATVAVRPAAEVVRVAPVMPEPDVGMTRPPEGAAARAAVASRTVDEDGPSVGEARHLASLLPQVRGGAAQAVGSMGQPSSGPDEDVQRRERIAALDWSALQADVAQCRACGLCDSRKNTVFGVGHAHAHWMVVGEAPGEQEDLQGEPFVGAAGQLLDNMLRALGLGRTEGGPDKQVFIANTLKCRPPRNRNPDPQELDRCAPYLRRQIELVQPRIILAMGRFAVQSLLQSDEPIGRLRGRVHRHAGVPVIVTYHPAYLLRNLVDKGRAWEDLCLAQAVLDGVVS